MSSPFQSILDGIIADLSEKQEAARCAFEATKQAGRMALKHETSLRILTALLAPPRQHSMPEMVELALAGAEHLISQLEEEARHVAARKV